MDKITKDEILVPLIRKRHELMKQVAMIDRDINAFTLSVCETDTCPRCGGNNDNRGTAELLCKRCNKMERKSIGKEQAIKLADSGWWKDKSPREICDVQLFTEELCMPFSDFHGAIESALGRPVFTHEFGYNYDGIVKEYLGETPMPTIS